MSNNIKIDLSDLDLGKEINDILIAYNRDLQEDINEIQEEFYNKVADAIKKQ